VLLRPRFPGARDVMRAAGTGHVLLAGPATDAHRDVHVVCCRRIDRPSRSFTVTSSSQLAFFGVRQVSSQTCRGGRGRRAGSGPCRWRHDPRTCFFSTREAFEWPPWGDLTAEGQPKSQYRSAARARRPDPSSPASTGRLQPPVMHTFMTLSPQRTKRWRKAASPSEPGGLMTPRRTSAAG
jgi:hypothetical protein